MSRCINWLRWKWRQHRQGWERPCGCKFEALRDGSWLGTRCWEHWLD